MLRVSKSHISVVFLMLILVACGRKSALEDATGDVPVQIGIQTSPTSYSLQQVNLSGISNLKEVSGSYARFFYAPGSEDNHLTGNAPQANFIRTNSFFVPSDMVSMQMATIYYHMQNLAAFDKVIGAEGINQWPRSVGLETQIIENNSTRRNNAFYNGQTDSMMFVPFTGNELPISMNAGIIAHEHFHSLFYKIVIRAAIQNKKILVNAASIHSDETKPAEGLQISDPTGLSEKENAQLFNETYLRGINEGMADFWGWIYTSDASFINWSLPEFEDSRTLNLEDYAVGYYETDANIKNKIQVLVKNTKDPRSGLANYAYTVGTPYARFLKTFTTMQVENKKIALGEAKKLTAQMIFKYITSMGAQFSAMKETEMLPTGGLFNFIAQEMKMTKTALALNDKDCEFLAKYINKELTDDKKIKVCEVEAKKLAEKASR
ncbi:MAG: hypothetical protein H7328_11585 [Bdellovibrio sp.]|nr:hypothetical protein [Bdellovibrio sp.]